MSAGDYISLKKTKLLQNYHINTASTVNIPQTSYENYVHNLNLRAVKCSTSTYGNGVAKPLTINNMLVGRTTTCPANTYEGPITYPIINADVPLISVPTVPTKFQMPATKAQLSLFLPNIKSLVIRDNILARPLCNRQGPTGFQMQIQDLIIASGI